MHRFFVDSSAISDDTVTITGDDVAHISRVLRLRPDDEIMVCDSRGTDYLCSVSSIDKSEVRAWILKRNSSQSEPPVSITLYQGVAKGDKLDTVVQKCVELGAVRIVPVAMKRSVAVIKDGAKRRDRMQRIALEAAKQSGRAVVPEVSEVMSFSSAIEEASNGFDLRLVPYEAEDDNSIKHVLRTHSDAKSVCVFIGPEGGFADEEIELAKSRGFVTVSMGPRILRTETAPVAAISAVLYELGDW